MAPPKPLTGKLVQLAESLAKALDSRSGALSEAGEKALQRAAVPWESPLGPRLPGDEGVGDMSVQVDKALTEGTVKEVTGTGTEPGEGPVWDLNATAKEFGDVNASRRDYNTSMLPVATGGGTTITDYGQSLETLQELSVADNPASVERLRRAQLSNINHPNFDTWEPSWKRYEHIPKFLGGVVAGGAALAAGKSEAAPADWEKDLQPAEDWEAGLDAAAPSDWEAGLDDGQQATMPDTAVTVPPVDSAALGKQLGSQQAAELNKQMTGEFGEALGGNPLAAAEWAVGKFKQHVIAPVMGLVQDKVRAGYESTIAPYWREKDPMGSMLAEGALKPLLGETSFNVHATSEPEKADVEKMAPGARKALSDASRLMGSTEKGDEAIAFALGLSHEVSNLPFYLINPEGGAVRSGAVGGFVSSLVQPGDGKPVRDAALGGGIGGAFEGAGALLSAGKAKLAPKVQAFLKNRAKAPKLEVDPIAVVPPDQVDDLAVALVNTGDQAVIPSKSVPDNALAVVVHKDAAGKVVAEAIVPPVVPKGTVGAKPSAIAKVRIVDGGGNMPSAKVLAEADVPVLATPEVKDAAALDPGGQEAYVTQAGKHRIWDEQTGEMVSLDGDAFSSSPRPYERVSLRGDKTDWVTDQMDLTDWTPEKAKQVGGEGLVLALKREKGGEPVTVLYDAASDKALEEILLSRSLMKVKKKEDGQWYWGYLRNGAVVAPDPEEFIPDAAVDDMARDFATMKPWEVTPGSSHYYEPWEDVREPTRMELREMIARRKVHLEEMQAEADLAKIDDEVVAQELMAGGSGKGDSLPPPPPMDPPPPPPPGSPGGPKDTNFDALDEIRVRAAPSLLNKISRQALPPTARGPIDVVNAAIAKASIDNLERLAPDVLQSLDREFREVQKLPVAQKRQVLSSMNEFVEGNISADELVRRHPEVSAGIRRRLEVELEQIARDDKEIRALGMLMPEGEMRKLLELDEDDGKMLYTGVRAYWRHLLPAGEWQKVASKDRQGMRALKQAIVEDVYSTKKYANMSMEDKNVLAERHLDFLMGDPVVLAEARKNPESAWKDVISEAGQSLKARKDLRWWEKAALGEIDSPQFRVALTRQRQAQLKVQGGLWKGVADNPALSTAADNIAAQEAIGHTVQVPLNAAKYGFAAGKYVHPETWEALEQIPLMQRNVQGFVGKIINGLKYGQTVGNPGSWVTNTLGNLQNIMMSGLLNPFASPLQLGRGIRTFAQDYKAHMLAPGVKGDARRERFLKAMEYGILGSDYATAEFRLSANAWAREVEAEANRFQGRVDGLSLMAGLSAKKDKLASYYGAIDPIAKYTAWSEGLRKGGIDAATNKLGEVNGRLKAARFLGKSLYHPALSDEQVTQRVFEKAAREIHLSFPMLDRVAPAVTNMAKGIGVINPYIKIRMEQLRVYANLPKRMLDDPRFAANQLGYAAIFASLYFGVKAAREHAGVSQQKVDEAFASAPQSIQRFKPGALATWWRDDKGRLQFVDLTQTFEPMTYLQGDPNSSVVKRVLTNLAISPIDGSLTEPGLVNMLAAGGLMDPAYREAMVPEWQQGGMRLMGDIVGRLGPGVIRNTYNTLERGAVGFNPKMTNRGPTEPQSALTTTINATLGPNRTFAFGSEHDKQMRIKEATGKYNQSSYELSKVEHMTEGQSTGILTPPLNREEAIERAKEIRLRRGAERRDTKDKVGK